jgi:hypothetical protein
LMSLSIACRTVNNRIRNIFTVCDFNQFIELVSPVVRDDATLTLLCEFDNEFVSVGCVYCGRLLD